MSSPCRSVITTPSGTLHVTAARKLAMNNRHALFAAGHQAVIVTENLCRDFGAKPRHGRFQIWTCIFTEFELLKFDQILKHLFHKIMQV